MKDNTQTSNRAYQFADETIQELDAIDIEDREARSRFLLRSAVLKFVEGGDNSALIDLFEKGFPLHKYEESRELFIDLLSGIPIRSLEKTAAIKNQDAEMKACYYYATLTGAGKSAEEAAELAARDVPCDSNHFMTTIWPKFENRPGVKIAYDMAKNPPDSFPEFF